MMHCKLQENGHQLLIPYSMPLNVKSNLLFLTKVSKLDSQCSQPQALVHKYECVKTLGERPIVIAR